MSDELTSADIPEPQEFTVFEVDHLSGKLRLTEKGTVKAIGPDQAIMQVAERHASLDGKQMCALLADTLILCEIELRFYAELKW